MLYGSSERLRQEGSCSTPESGGETVLQDAICRYFERYDIHYDRSEILVTNGGSQALNMVFTAVINPGEEAIIAEPFYTNYHTFITAAGGRAFQ